ncbi:MAG: type II toxin-antitoxin system HicB family antitoxin [Candidatus Yanofskybacteria bacterium]|nr:type II toxin-antitoxin system HicB family antitoxin [Candidatus Yanofskybacteria bacterium]
MLIEFLDKQLKKAKFKVLKDETYFGSIPGFPGVWANSKTLNICKKELREVLEEWLFLKVRNKERVPGFEIKLDRRSMFKHA